MCLLNSQIQNPTEHTCFLNSKIQNHTERMCLFYSQILNHTEHMCLCMCFWNSKISNHIEHRGQIEEEKQCNGADHLCCVYPCLCLWLDYLIENYELYKPSFTPWECEMINHIQICCEMVSKSPSTKEEIRDILYVSFLCFYTLMTCDFQMSPKEYIYLFLWLVESLSCRASLSHKDKDKDNDIDSDSMLKIVNCFCLCLLLCISLYQVFDKDKDNYKDSQFLCVAFVFVFCYVSHCWPPYISFIRFFTKTKTANSLQRERQRQRQHVLVGGFCLGRHVSACIRSLRLSPLLLASSEDQQSK